LYVDNARTTPWGNTSGVDGNPWTSPQADLTVYGRIPQRPAGGGVPPGAYTDTVTATINY